MNTISNYNFKGKRVLIRVDFNVPLEGNGNVADNTRIKAALPTIEKIAGDGGRVILMSHLGRPKGGFEQKYSMKPVAKSLSQLLNRTIPLADDCVGDSAKALVAGMNDGDIVLLENLRFHKEEEGGDEFFAGQLAELGDVYVNDAFGTAHRAHASTAIIARFFPTDKMFGFLMQDEVDSIDRVLKSSEKPVTAIIGGSKVSSKIAILENLVERVDNILIGGAMAYTFIKAQGGKIGKSLVEDDKMGMALDLLKKAEAKGVRIVLPIDTVIADRFSIDAKLDKVDIFNIPDEWIGMDIGPDTGYEFRMIIKSSKTILWNGPMGVFEMDPFSKGTLEVADAVADATKAGAFSLIGGGDSVAAVNIFGYADKVSYISTGGGAMLESLEGIELPGIAAIRS